MNLKKPILVVLTALVLLAGCASGNRNLAGKEALPDPAAALEEKWGIEIVGIRLSGGGYFLDFRYLVKNPEKASLFVKRSIKPYLIDQKTGSIMGVPTPAKLGPMRQTAVKPYRDKMYFIFFANPGRFIKPGAKVTVVIGELRLENLIVE